MTSNLSTTETQAFQHLLSTWNNQQDLRTSNAPFPARITSLEQVHQARTEMYAVRHAA